MAPTRMSSTFENSYLTMNTLPKSRGIQLPMLSNPKIWYGVDGMAELIIRKGVNRGDTIPRIPHSRQPLSAPEIAEIMRRARVDPDAIRRQALQDRHAREARDMDDLRRAHASRPLVRTLSFGDGDSSPPPRRGVKRPPRRS